MAKIGAGAKRTMDELEVDIVALRNEVENFYCFGHDLRTDAIAVE